jgi:uncharacterized protein YggE
MALGHKHCWPVDSGFLRSILGAAVLGAAAVWPAAAMSAGSAPQQAGPSIQQARPSITVSGTGEVLVDPDHASLVVAVESEGSTSAAAAADNARITRAVTTALVNAGAQRGELSTSDYSVQPQWQYSNSAPPRRTGYRASTAIRIADVQLARLGPWIDAALSAGAARIEQLQFEPRDAAGARRRALARAVANARADAAAVAEAAGGALGPLQEISTGQGGARPQPLLMAAQRQAGPETNLQPGPLHISAAVVARWAFEPER